MSAPDVIVVPPSSALACPRCGSTVHLIGPPLRVRCAAHGHIFDLVPKSR